MRIKDFLNRTHWKFAGLFYSVAWVKTIDEPSTVGFCDTEARILYMKDGEEITETVKTLLHEQLHAMDDTYKIKLSHTQVRKLELALYDFLINNGLIK
jgi:hypothetical protein